MIIAPPPDPACRHCGRAFPRETTLGLCPVCVWNGIALDAALDLALPGLEIVDELARGGMGVVYRAREAEAGREVAVKMLLPALADEPEMRERFAQETRAVGTLDHAGILPVYRVGESNGVPYFTMKLARGGTLAERRATLGGRWREIAALIASVAEAVHHAHQHGLLHRDLKPGNILFDETGRAYVSDFGLVKVAGTDAELTRSVAVLGTPHYLAPEVANRDARAASVASDVWSLGAMLYELLAGRLPFEAESVPALLRKIVEEEPAPLLRKRPNPSQPAASGVQHMVQAPRDLATVTLKCLAKEPARRYASAGALAEDLSAWLAGRPIVARPTTTMEHALAFVRRNPVLAALATLLALSLAVGGGLLWQKNTALNSALDAALAQAQANRQVGRPGQRQKMIEALRQIAALQPTPAVREEATIALALPDLRELRRVPFVNGAAPFFDAEFNRFLALEGDGVLRVRDVWTGAEIATVPAQGQKIISVRGFSPDGQIAAFRVEDKSLRLWHFDRRESHGEFPAGWDKAVFSPDSTRLALAALGRDEVLVHDLRQSAAAPPAARFSTGWKDIEPLAWSPDGRRLAGGRAEGHMHEVLIVDAATGVRERVLTHPAKGRINRVSWFPQGNGVAVTGGFFDVYVWKFEDSAQQSALLQGHSLPAVAVACSPDGAWFATSGWDHTVRLWDAATRETMLTVPGRGERLEFSRDGRRLLVEHLGLDQCVVCEVAPSEVCRQIRIPLPMDDEGIFGSFAAEFSRDGNQLAVGDYRGLYFFDARSGAPGLRVPCNWTGTNAFAPNDTLYAGGVGFLRRWRLAADEARLDWEAAPTKPPSTYNRLSLSADGSLLAVSAGKTVQLFHSGETRPFRTLPAPPGVNPLALSPDGRTVAASSITQPGLWIWDTETGKLRAKLASTIHPFPCFSADSRSLWVHDSFELRQLDVATLTVQRTVPRLEPGSGIYVVSRSGDGRVLAAPLDATSLSLLDAATGRSMVRIVHPRPRQVQWAALNYDATRLAVSCGGHVIQLWNLSKLRERLRDLGLDWDAPQP